MLLMSLRTSTLAEHSTLKCHYSKSTIYLVGPLAATELGRHAPATTGPRVTAAAALPLGATPPVVRTCTHFAITRINKGAHK